MPLSKSLDVSEADAKRMNDLAQSILERCVQVAEFANDFPEIARRLMAEAAKIKAWDKPKKRQVVLQVLQDIATVLVDEHKFSPEILLLVQAAPAMMHLYTSLEAGKLEINGHPINVKHFWCC